MIEQYDQLYALPRAVHFDDETMRVFQACGLANEVAKILHVNKGMKFNDTVSFRMTNLEIYLIPRRAKRALEVVRIFRSFGAYRLGDGWADWAKNLVG